MMKTSTIENHHGEIEWSSSDESEQEQARVDIEDCPSTHDPITADELPRRHVCLISRDGSRQCFALSTLHKIALTANLKRFRDDLGNQVQTFLAPPHFRTPMSDDMLDQIASRFGREALDLEGPFYIRPERPASGTKANGEDDDSDGMEDYSLHRALEDNDEFLKLVQGYAKAQMGSRDLYVCPLCYCVAQKVFCEKNPFQSKTKKSERPKHSSDIESIRQQYLGETRLQDPMAVLKILDKKYTRELEIASTFCSTKVAVVKAHIRNHHYLKTTGIQGNDLYARYKIRGQDGLLQRFLFNRSGHHSQGDMMRYWNTLGCNFDFVHLLCLVDRAQILAQINDSEANEEVNDMERKEAQKYWERATEYFASFGGISGKLWELLSEPYRKSGGADMKDFISDDADVEAENHQAYEMDSFRKQQREEEERDRLVVERLQAEFSDNGEEEEEYDGISEAQSKSEEESDDDSVTQWQRDLEKRRRKPARQKANEKKPARIKRLSQDDDESEEEFEYFSGGERRVGSFEEDDDDESQNKTPTKRRRRIKLDDDDDEED